MSEMIPWSKTTQFVKDPKFLMLRGTTLMLPVTWLEDMWVLLSRNKII
jgi:hypothetical protein